MEKPKIVVVGSSNTDMVVKVPYIPASGETILGTDFMTIPGGKGANQAVAAARAGTDVTFIACVSDDSFGKQAIENYRNEGIDTSCIKIQPGIHSGIALINVAEGGENSISVAPGANSYLFPEDIYGFEDVFEGAKMVLAQLEVPLETVEAAAEVAHEKGIPFILNPAPGAAIPESLLSKVTIISPNETEAAIITSRNEFSEKDVPIMAEEIFEKGGTTVLLTLGGKGVYLKTFDFEGIIPGYKVKAVDTTAAGDVFNGALAAALAGEMDLKEAVDFAQRAAAISVTRMGAQPSAPTLEEIQHVQF
ncbi:ribokinase [Tangfeifania diversioriginum]|uniref:Ribokinase n=1 Tax=Tangfeifania diversioriginum TaxID=1168035 RepID=A0A1M6EPC6_9BACT|nr:ribokinase [Tangfeifania diversioriginum]SHI87332.1 ribokinase [Tangfeifania diversioriginum]